MPNDLFSADQSQTQEDLDYLTLMKEKFKDDKGELDQKALARGKYEADKHIETIESELAELRSEVKTRLSLEQFMDKLNTRESQGTTNQATNPGQRDENGTQALSKEDVTRLFAEMMSNEKSVSTQERNVNYARVELEKQFGSNYVAELKNVAKTYNKTEDQIRAMAANDPQVLIGLVATVAKPVQRQPDISPPRSSVFQRPSGNMERNRAYYENLKKQDPKSYFSKDVTIQRHRDAIRLGEAYNA